MTSSSDLFLQNCQLLQWRITIVNSNNNKIFLIVIIINDGKFADVLTSLPKIFFAPHLRLFQGNNKPMMVIESLRKVRTGLEAAEQARGASGRSKLTKLRLLRAILPSISLDICPHGPPISHVRASMGQGDRATHLMQVSWSAKVCSSRYRHR
jgi:hypothetical protein